MGSNFDYESFYEDRGRDYKGLLSYEDMYKYSCYVERDLNEKRITRYSFPPNPMCVFCGTTKMTLKPLRIINSDVIMMVCDMCSHANATLPEIWTLPHVNWQPKPACSGQYTHKCILSFDIVDGKPQIQPHLREDFFVMVNIIRYIISSRSTYVDSAVDYTIVHTDTYYSITVNYNFSRFHTIPHYMELEASKEYGYFKVDESEYL